MKHRRGLAILVPAGISGCAAALKKQPGDWRFAVGARMPTPNPEPVEPFPPRKPEK